MPDDEGDEAARKLAAKRFNEQLKLFVTFVNSLGLGAIGAGVIIPASKSPFDVTLISVGWFVIGLFLHLIGQGAYRFLRSEG